MKTIYTLRGNNYNDDITYEFDSEPSQQNISQMAKYET